MKLAPYLSLKATISSSMSSSYSLPLTRSCAMLQALPSHCLTSMLNAVNRHECLCISLEVSGEALSLSACHFISITLSHARQALPKLHILKHVDNAAVHGRSVSKAQPCKIGQHGARQQWWAYLQGQEPPTCCRPMYKGLSLTSAVLQPTSSWMGNTWCG